MNYKSKAFRNNIYARILAPIGYTIILLYTYKANMLEGKTVAAHFPHYKFSWWYLIPCVVLIHFFFLLKRWYLYICVIYKYNKDPHKDSTSIYTQTQYYIYIVCRWLSGLAHNFHFIVYASSVAFQFSTLSVGKFVSSSCFVDVVARWKTIYVFVFPFFFCCCWWCYGGRIYFATICKVPKKKEDNLWKFMCICWRACYVCHIYIYIL